ncbi:MAG TPA: hypothetical protein VL135_17055 [Terracidiphilus sp.]|jgi:hypothetical protein|nr:hypothetical protein [Terracidiphilus sp.]
MKNEQERQEALNCGSLPLTKRQIALSDLSRPQGKEHAPDIP